MVGLCLSFSFQRVDRQRAERGALLSAVLRLADRRELLAQRTRDQRLRVDDVCRVVVQPDAQATEIDGNGCNYELA
jgi:hypothetical protein